MENKTTRIRERTLERLRYIHAHTGQSNIETLDRLVEREYRKLKREYEKKERGANASESDN